LRRACLSVHEHTIRYLQVRSSSNFLQLHMEVACNVLCTLAFTDDAMLAHNGRNGRRKSHILSDSTGGVMDLTHQGTALDRGTESDIYNCPV